MKDILASAAQVVKATGGKLVAGDAKVTCSAVGTDSRARWRIPSSWL
jgi:hypothetical protein